MRQPDRPEAGPFDTSASGTGWDKLAERLLRLPDGHPSSPRAEDREREADDAWPDADLEDPGQEQDGPPGQDQEGNEPPGQDPAGESGRGVPSPAGRPTAFRAAGPGAGARDPYRPWFAGGGPAEPWFAADAGGAVTPDG